MPGIYDCPRCGGPLAERLRSNRESLCDAGAPLVCPRCVVDERVRVRLEMDPWPSRPEVMEDAHTLSGSFRRLLGVPDDDEEEEEF